MSDNSVRVFTTEDVAIIVDWFGGDGTRFLKMADSDVVNVGIDCEWDDDQGHNSMRRLRGPWVEKPASSRMDRPS